MTWRVSEPYYGVTLSKKQPSVVRSAGDTEIQVALPALGDAKCRAFVTTRSCWHWTTSTILSAMIHGMQEFINTVQATSACSVRSHRDRAHWKHAKSLILFYRYAQIEGWMSTITWCHVLRGLLLSSLGALKVLQFWKIKYCIRNNSDTTGSVFMRNTYVTLCTWSSVQLGFSFQQGWNIYWQ
jgi:hypothetical protein